MRKSKLAKWGIGLFLTICGILLPFLAIAADSKDAGIVAENVFSGIMTIKSIVRNVCIIVGAFLILSSFFQYRKYRRNPSEMPVSRPITTLIVGIVLIAVTFIPIQFNGL
jgi:uncharacterized membrane protein